MARGNPYHVPAGQPTGGQFTSGPDVHASTHQKTGDKTSDAVLKSTLQSLSQKWENAGVRNFIADRPARNEVQLSDLVVPKEQQGKGVGSKFMAELTSIADQAKKTLTLTPAQRDDKYGTTSQKRLKEFYKGFGFVENKGRNKDFTISDLMYRKPKTI